MALIEARGVTKRFGGLAAVSEVSFDLQDGEIPAGARLKSITAHA